MSTIYVEPAQKAGEVLHLVQSAIKSEMTKLELGLEMARKRLAPFEQKYGVSSEHFIAEMAAEDLAGGDYRLKSSSPYAGTGANGADYGADIDAVAAATGASL